MKKRFAIIVIFILTLSLIGCEIPEFSLRDEIQNAVDTWAEKNDITITDYSYEKVKVNTFISLTDGCYSITIEYDGFADLTPEQMKTLIKSWEKFHTVYVPRLVKNEYHDFWLKLDYIVSNGNTYEINDSSYVKLNGITIVKDDTIHFSNSGSNNSGSQKTAKCNYCNGPGKVLERHTIITLMTYLVINYFFL